MRILALAAALAAGQADAATYSYFGNPIPCWSDCGLGSGVTTIKGTVTTAYAIKNGSFIAETVNVGPPFEYKMTLTRIEPGGTNVWTGHDWADSGFITKFTGDFGDTFYPIALDTYFRLDFDSKGRVTFWRTSGINGGSWDWSSRVTGDANGHGWNRDPGRWVAGEVPLPATLPLLGAALAALWYRRAPRRNPLSA